ncbi:MAG: hypothetical protein IAE88_08555 [Rhodobacteraceae bacterium]|nr:hypothetical protein [Paracoccaceae bacterium]
MSKPLPDNQPPAASASSLKVLASTLFAALLAGACAPDAFRPDPPYEAYLNQVQNQCAYKRIGRMEINSDFLQDSYFLDITSRFFNLESSQAEYLASLEGAYGATPDSPGVRCMLRLLPPRALPPPAVPPPPAMDGRR